MTLKKRDVWLIATGCLILSLLLVACGTELYAGNGTERPLRTDGTPIALDNNTLLGSSLQEIGQRAQRDAAIRHEVLGGTPEVVLTRFVSRQDLQELGLNCLPDWGYIEEPPYALVILKGSFQANFPGTQAIRPPSITHIAYVYDIWAGQITTVDASTDPGHFKKALNDARMPDPVAAPMAECPPYAGKRLHYGSVLPTPVLTQAPFEPQPTQQPGPVSTEMMPIPMPSK